MFSSFDKILRRLGVPVRDVRVPIRLQFQTTECGVGALAMLLAHFGRFVTMEELRAATGVSRDCVNAAEIVRAARHYGLECKAYSREPYMLAGLKPPYIVHVRFIHFMIVEGVTDTEVLLADPHQGRMRTPRATFEEAFTGVVLVAKPGPDFVPAGGDIDPLVSLWRRMDRRGRAAMMRASVLAGLTRVTLPFVGLGLGLWAAVVASGRDGGSVAAVVFFAIGIWSVSSMIGCRWLDRAREIVSDGQAALLARHYAAMPAGFFAYRIPSRLHESLGSGDTAVSILCDTIIPSIAHLTTLPVALALLWLLSPDVAIGVSALTALHIASMEVLYRLRGDTLRLRMLTGAEEAGQLNAGRDDLTDSKLSGKDHEFVQNRLAAVAGGQSGVQKAAPLDALAASASGVTVFGVLCVVLLSGADGTVSSQLSAVALMTLGLAAAIAVQAWLPLRRGLDAARQELLYVDDLLQSRPADAAEGQPGMNSDLPDDVVVRATALTFGYSRTRTPLIRDVSLDLHRGEQLGIAGPSGGGKSTLAALLAGDLRPWSGTVERTPTRQPQSVAWVNKATFFFDGTVRANLTLWDESVPDDDIRAAVRDAGLDDVLAAREGGLDAMVVERGRNFSGGQRQRLEIARALLRNPLVIVLDEATDALDPVLEARIRVNIRRRGCSLIMVSHRASTLAACDRVLRVDEGRITAHGDSESNSCAVDEPPPGPPITDDAPAETPPDLGRLAPAFACVAAQYGIRHGPVDVPSLERGHLPPVVALARAHGMHVRRIRIVVQDWWRMVDGPLVCLRKGSGAPLVILTDGCEPRCVDPANDEVLAIEPHAGLEPDAYAFQPFPGDTPIDTSGVITRGIVAASGPLVNVMLAGLAVFACWLALALFAMRMLDVPSGLSYSSGVVLAAMMMVAQGLLEYARSIAGVRAGSIIRRTALGLFVQKPVRIQGAFLMRLPLDRLLRATNALRRALGLATGEHLPPIVDVISTVIAIAGLAWLHVRFGMAGVLVLLVVAGVPALLSVRRVSREARIEEKRLVSRRFLYDVLTGIFRLRLLDTASKALERWVAMHRKDMRRDRYRRLFDADMQVLREAAPWCAIALMLIASSGTHDMPPWMIAAAILLTWYVAISAGNLQAALVAVARCRPLIELSDVLGTAPLEPDPPLTQRAALPIELENVTYSYPGVGTRALDGISLRVEPGEFVAITGPSGGGKSTLLRMILGFDEPASGRVVFDGPLGPAAERVVWRRGVSSVGQDEQLNFARTLRSQVSGLAPYGVEDVWKVLQTVLIADDVRRMPMGLQTIVESGKISTGQEQRLVIARALLCKPSVLILDEATNAIPDSMQAQLFANLRAMGLTLILVTHRETAIDLMDRVVVIENGRVSWSGTPAELKHDAHASALLAAERQEGHL
jgi:ABC-type bacteriocin/lantibiotic exporter with double-glycine peptidase domain